MIRAPRRSPKPRTDYWSDAELAILHERYATTSRAQMVALLPRRAWTSIMTKAQSLGLAQRSRRTPILWTDADRAKLRELYPTNSVAVLLRHFPGRTRKSIEHEAARLGVQHTTEFWKGSNAKNHPRSYPPELRALIHLNNKLKKAINAREQPQHR